MHFDILLPDSEKKEQKVFAFGKGYLKEKGQNGQRLTNQECRFCHMEKASRVVEDDIAAKDIRL